MELLLKMHRGDLPWLRPRRGPELLCTSKSAITGLGLGHKCEELKFSFIKYINH